MKFYSEKLNRMFDTEKALVAAEQAAVDAELAKKAEEEKKSAERKARAAEVDTAYKAMVEARKNYSKVLTNFCKDYGAYHCSISGDEARNLLDNFDLDLEYFNNSIADLARRLSVL